MSFLQAVPSQQFKLQPDSFQCALQLRLRLPLTLLQGIVTCKCGAHCDAFGDHLYNCGHFKHLRIPGHNLLEGVVADMARCASKTVSWDSKRGRAQSIAYSPLHCPDLTLLHGASDHTHVIIDIVGPSVVAPTGLVGAASTSRAPADAAEARKFRSYGPLAPHTLVPFAVEDSGALGREAVKLFKDLQKQCRNKLGAHRAGLQTWAARGFASFYLQSLSVANLRGQGHYFMTAASALRMGQ